MRAIITVKLQKNPNHNPDKKLTGRCPVTNQLCTDITGEHHSFIEYGRDLDGIRQKIKDYHVTRIEAISRKPFRLTTY